MIVMLWQVNITDASKDDTYHGCGLAAPGDH